MSCSLARASACSAPCPIAVRKRFWISSSAWAGSRPGRLRTMSTWCGPISPTANSPRFSTSTCRPSPSRRTSAPTFAFFPSIRSTSAKPSGPDSASRYRRYSGRFTKLWWESAGTRPVLLPKAPRIPQPTERSPANPRPAKPGVRAPDHGLHAAANLLLCALALHAIPPRKGFCGDSFFTGLREGLIMWKRAGLWLIRNKLGKVVLGTALIGGAALGLYWGYSDAVTPVRATPPTGTSDRSAPAQPVTESVPLAPPSGTDYSRRVVAYYNGTVPVTREDLGEYLIARMGAERLENLVNKKIIEYYCRDRGIEVTAAEVEAAYIDDLKG